MAHGAPSTLTYTYDVFLNFRGKDTRTGFTGNLYHALCQRGILTFMDDKDLRSGEEITPALLKAVKNSRLAIIVFSRNYATSSFCLNELVEILKCIKAKGRSVWPVFYDVDPSELRYQTGNYEKAFAKYEGRFKDSKEKVQNWRSALYEAANLSGFHFEPRNEYEHVFIGRIIDEVSSKINRRLLHVANYPVGLEARMQEVQSLLNDELDKKVSMLGIYGIGGMGKSTIARALYNLMADQFESYCFVADVREKSITKHGLVQIQETLLFELVREKNIKLGDVNQGIPILKRRLHNKRVLVILDDVDKREQLLATAGELDWFGSGSLIIVTTRDEHLLDIHGVDRKYEVNELNDTEALELFRWNAFKEKEVDPNYMEIMKRAMNFAHGLPLYLETIGSNLYGKTLDEWKSALDAYERIPCRNVQEILRVSFDGLEQNEKECFLDIACFFKGCTLRYVKNMLHAGGFYPEYSIRVLAKKSLIKILYGYYVTMHDLIQSMGKEVVRQESPLEAEERSRLWFHEDIVRVLEKNKENVKVQALMLNLPEDREVHWNQKSFGKMKNLRMLVIKNACFLKSPKHLPTSLRVLEWWRYPSSSLPSNFLSNNLVILNLSHSCFQWDKPIRRSQYLSHMIFTGCEYLRQVPDLSGFPNLTELCVDDCTNLIEIHDSVGFLDKLRRFNAKGCTKLRVVPRGIKLTNLEYLCLRDCISLENFPEILAPMEKLHFVDLEGTAIENLPLSMQNLKGLQNLCLKRCKMLNNNVLSNIIQMMPYSFPILERLNLTGTNLTILPACINDCHFLWEIILENCKQLQEIRGLPPSIAHIWAQNCTSLNSSSPTLNTLLSQAITNTTLIKKSFTLPGQRIPEWFDHSSRGDSVCFWFREEFPFITACAVFGVGDIPHPIPIVYQFCVKINGTKLDSHYYSFRTVETDHILVNNQARHIVECYGEGLYFGHEWSHAEVSCVLLTGSDLYGSVTRTGVLVNRAVSSMDDVRFTNPNPPEKACTLMDKGLRETRDIQQRQQQQQLALFKPILPICSKTVEIEYPREDKSRTLDDICNPDRAIPHHPAKAPGDSSEAPNFAETQSIQASSPISSSCQASGELHLGTSPTLLPTTIDESRIHQTELAVDGDVEMEAFYASLDAERLILSHSQDKSANTADNEEAKEALKVIQAFTNDASFFLNPEWRSLYERSEDYIWNFFSS